MDDPEHYEEQLVQLQRFVAGRSTRTIQSPSDLEVGSEVYATFLPASQKNMYACVPSWGRVIERGQTWESIIVQSGSEDPRSLLGHLGGCKGISYTVYLVNSSADRA